jgi:hypothetical protein
MLSSALSNRTVGKTVVTIAVLASAVMLATSAPASGAPAYTT